jgi:sugar lactone lactonase YvrE
MGEPSSPGSESPAATRRLLLDGLGFAEGPRWRDGALWVSDIGARTILRLDESGAVLERLPAPGRPSGLGWLPDGRLIAVMMDERAVLRYEAHDWALHADLSELAGAPLNDMVVSAAGNAYVTGLGYDASREEPRPTQIILVRPDGAAEPQQPLLWRPNGCVITPDGETLIVAETRVHRLTALRIGADGTLSGSSTVAVLPRGTWADGICLDVEGAIWVADPKGCACRRVSRDGEVLALIDTAPVPCVACTLGGDDGRTLFLLLGELGDFDDLGRRALGRIETLRVAVPGAGSP